MQDRQLAPAKTPSCKCAAKLSGWWMTLPDRQPTMVLYPQGTCTHTTLRRSSLLPFSNGFLRKPSGYITGFSEPWQPHTKTSMHSLGVSTHCWECYKFTRRYYVGPCHVECVVNAASVIFQAQVRALWLTKLVDSWGRSRTLKRNANNRICICRGKVWMGAQTE